MKWYWKPLMLVFAVIVCALLAVVCIELLAQATGSALPEGWMLSTGPLP